MSAVTLTKVTPEQYLEPGYYLARLEVTRGDALSLTREHLETPLKEQYGARVDLLTYTPSQDGREVLLQVRVNPFTVEGLDTQAVPVVPLIWLGAIVVVTLGAWGVSYNWKDSFRIDSEDIAAALSELADSFQSPGGQFAAVATTSAWLIAALALLVWAWPKGER